MHGQKSTKQRSGQCSYLSNKRQKFDGILTIYACSFGLRPLWRLFCTDCCPLGARWLSRLSRVERCPLLGGMEFVHCTEVVRLSESPLLEVSMYFKGNIYSCIINLDVWIFTDHMHCLKNFCIKILMCHHHSQQCPHLCQISF